MNIKTCLFGRRAMAWLAAAVVAITSFSVVPNAAAAATSATDGSRHPRMNETASVGATGFFTVDVENYAPAQNWEQLPRTGELWAHDGSAGVAKRLVTFTNPADYGSAITDLTVLNGKLYFLANDTHVADNPYVADSDMSLWTSDGTVGGTQKVFDAGDETNSEMYNLVAVQGRLVFTAYDQATSRQAVYASDGTAGGTKLISREVSPTGNLGDGGLTVVGDRAFFFGFDPSTYDYGMWTTDGTTGGTAKVPGATTVLMGVWKSPFKNGVIWGDEATPLAFTDGTSTGTRTMLDSGATGTTISTVRTTANDLYFTKRYPVDGREALELWCVAGAEGQAKLLKGDDPQVSEYYIPGFVSSADVAYMQVQTLPTMRSSLYRFNCSGSIAEPLTAPDGSAFTDVVTPEEFAGKVYFNSNTSPTHGLWTVTTGAPTFLHPGMAGILPGSDTAHFFDYDMTQLPVVRQRLWVTDGTKTGTRMITTLEDSEPSGGSVSFGFEATNGQVAGNYWFVGRTDVKTSDTVSPETTRLWSTDGTAAATRLIADLLTGHLESVMSTVPVISGTPKVGATLTAAPGTWGPAPVSLAYQWMRNSSPITGATAETYLLAEADLGSTITVRVTGSKTGYSSASAVSVGSATVSQGLLTPAPAPVITGTVKAGSSLTANTGTWGPAPVTLAYQWLRSGVAIPGATAKTLALTGADTGKTISVRVTATKPGYAPVVKTSAATPAVAAGTLAAPAPTITGTRKVAYTLTANPGTWGPAPVALRYQWYRSGVAITGATGRTYTLSGADATKGISVRVTGAKAGYTTVTKVSATTTAIAAGTLVAPVPTITGTKRVGYVLTANPGTWTVATTLKYQWYRSGIAIAGATGKTYRLVPVDRYDTMRVRVTGSKPGYATTAKFSASTVRVY